MTENELFRALGEALAPDAAVALRPIPLQPFSPGVGPYLKVQFVIELVGSQLIPEQNAKRLLEAGAKKALGGPEIYVMVPGQQRWRVLWQGGDSITYDSLSFAWDLVGARGRLSSASARELHARCEQIASGMERRAVPLRPIEDVDAAADNLQSVRDSLDVGMDAMVKADFDLFDSAEVIRHAYRLGYRIGASGLLEWRQQGWPEALMSIYPLGKPTEFDPARWRQMPGIGVGYSVPCSPSPSDALERLFATLDLLAAELGGSVTDDDGNSLDEGRRGQLRSALRSVLDTFAEIGLDPGSPEALRLFEP